MFQFREEFLISDLPTSIQALNKIHEAASRSTTTALKNELKYSPMSEGNTCIGEPNLEVLPLR